jgi:hypothetical protein
MDAEIAAFARRWGIPLADAQRFAAAVARRCGEIAATVEPSGLTDFESLALAEALGAQISNEIAIEFPDPGAERPEDRSDIWMSTGPRRR